MRSLICGSFAYDTIMVFHDRFKEHILPEKLHILNVSFLVPDMRREFGGCAGNIAYSLQQLGGKPVPMATVGSDFAPYAKWMTEKGIDQTHVRVLDDAYTAQCFITTDLDDNQITAFHPGAMGQSALLNVNEAQDIALGIISPDSRDGMIAHAAQFKEAGIPFIFDPGQGMPMFNGEDLNRFIEQADYVTVNDYEGALLEQRTGKKLAEIAKEVKALVLTKGGEGSVIYTEGQEIVIPCAKADAVLDPTGCGDAFRAGLLYGITHQMEWALTGRLASVLGALKIASRGGQNHACTPEVIEAKAQESYGLRFGF